ncbi:hypothetical protein HCU74_16225 [Spongiibacter sp. KMU-166]|uniref:Big-1 domain-containing protein n=1 Tax=Spongiibacter thalassae TaxID=2721624 RepID=A0ABX1GIC5_9GAMM|nr:Ig-like domain-containing protein [Spongiibacter thalassae]NKI18955.1 hypothetical protein [Spongiibacter thalassae]
MELKLRASMLALTIAALAGCGGGGGGSGPSLTPNNNPGSGDAGGGDTSTTVRFGLPSGGNFQDGVMQATPATLASGESAQIFVAFVDGDGIPSNVPADVTFTSTCIANGKSTINPATAANSNGSVEVTYTANGCNIEDNIIARTQINGTTFSANVAVATSIEVSNGGGGTGAGESPDTDIRFGILSGGSFNAGKISANFTDLRPGDTVDLAVSFVMPNGQPYTGPANVTFNSTCISAGLSTVAPANVTNTNGLIQSQYTSNTCNGEDNIIATASVDNATLTAGVILTTTAANRFGSFNGGRFSDGIMKTSASNLKTGDTAALTVQLLDSQQNPISGQNVRFSSGCVGTGLSAITSAAATGADGIATANYTASGCDGDDIVVAETRYAGQDLTATVTLSTDALQVRFGSFTNVTFNEGTISSSETSVIESGETTTLTVDFIDQNGDRFVGPADVFFTSACLSNGLAELAPAIATNNGGSASVVYTARGCNGNDTVTATTSAADNTLTATVTLVTDQPPLGALQFVSASPQIIGLKGTESINDEDNEDGREIGPQSTVTFKVTSTSGQPLPNQTVNFELVSGDTNSGNAGPDAFLNHNSAATNAGGLVTTVVTPGTTAMPVRVRATTTHEGATVTALSNSLAITTGIPDQNSIDISASCLNPDAWAYNGITTRVTAHLADRFNNPVPDGTTVIFWTEGGSIEGSCDTGTGGSPHGECSVLLRSQSPRPDNGRITILATAIGEESYDDTNPTNGRFDSPTTPGDLTTGERFYDIGEPFLDIEEDGLYDSVYETYTDTDGDNRYDRIPEPYYDTDRDGKWDNVFETYTDTDGDGHYDRFTETYTDTDGDGSYDNVSETYTDSNSNGAYDPGEPFNDINGDGNYDPSPEPFNDINGDRNFDPAPEPFADTNGDGNFDERPEPFVDLDDDGNFDQVAEPFNDINGDGNFDEKPELFSDFDNDNSRDAPNGVYDGLLCDTNRANQVCNPASDTVFVSDRLVIVFADATALNTDILIDHPRDGLGYIAANSSDVIDLTKGSATVLINVYDDRGQLPPGGTKITASTDLGEIPDIEYDVPNTNSRGPYSATFPIAPGTPPTEPKTGTMAITVETANCSEVETGTVTYTLLIPVIHNP